MAAVKRCVRKARFFAVREQNKGNQSLVWVSTPQRGKSFLFSVFQSHNCWPKADYYADPIPSFRFWSRRKQKLSRAKSKQASCAEMMLGSFFFLLV